MMLNCLDAGILRSYLRGESSELTGSIEEHLAECRKCQQLLEQLAEESDPRDRIFAEAIQAVRGRQTLGAPGAVLPQPTGNGCVASRQPPGNHDQHERYARSDKVDTIRDYRLLESIGQGGMGTVYRAVHTSLNLLVAIKILNPELINSEQAIARFKREMQVVAQLNHPQIVRALDAGEHEGKPFLVMEHVMGVDLGQLLSRLGPLPVAETCQAIHLAATALQFAHESKILHRDIKPSNLMLTTDGNVKLLDLGLAQTVDLGLDNSISAGNWAVGTFAYMAPEILLGGAAASSRTEVFSLGVTLFQLLTRIRPYERADLPAIISNIAHFRPDIPSQLATVIERMISRHPEERPASMREVIQLLAPFTMGANLLSLLQEYYRWHQRGEVAMSSRMFLTQAPPAPPIQVAQRAMGITSAPSRHLLQQSLVFAVLVAVALFGMTVWIAQQDRREGWLPPPDPDPPELYPVPDPAPELTPPALGRVKPVPHGDFIVELLKQGLVRLVDPSTQRGYPLTTETIEVPPGKYLLEFDSPVAIEENQSDYTVSAESDNTLNLYATLANGSFQFPTMPLQPGAYASYYGSLWRAGWAEDKQIQYELSLEVLSREEAIDGTSRIWLRVSGKHTSDANGYTETAYLKIDPADWPRKLGVDEGYVEITGRSLERSEAKSQPETPRSFVIPFDPSVDLLAEAGNIELPEHRISIYDFLTLFFGTNDLAAADETIRAVRASLATPGQRNTFLEDINNGRGVVPCYVVSSTPRGKQASQHGYSLARRDAEPFGFVQLHVSLPKQLIASCLIQNSEATGRGSKQLAMERELERLRGLAIDPAQFEPAEISPQLDPNSFIARHFDLASLPDISSQVTWTGTISRNGQEEVMTIECRSLDEASTRQPNCRCLEVRVNSDMSNGSSHQEFARLWIDGDAYESRAEFRIVEGWIAFDNMQNIYALPKNGDLTSIIDARLQRGTATHWQRTGVADVLALLFDAQLRPKSSCSLLRALLAAKLAGADRTPIAVTRNTKPLGETDGFVWEQVGLYQFFRSERVPFGFVSAKFKFGQFSLDLELAKNPALDGKSESIFPTENQIASAIANNTRLIQAKAREGWQVWSWEHEGTTHKAWAEFAGEIKNYNKGSGSLLLLHDGTANSIRVPLSELSPAAAKLVRQGRSWRFTSEKLRLIADDGTNVKFQPVTFDASTKVTSFTRELKSLMPDDREWIGRLRTASRRSQRPEDILQEWQSFPLYRSDW